MLKRGLLFCFLAAAPVLAQVDTGTITGSLHDQAGGVIPSAQVTITNQSTGVSTSATTDVRGGFSSPPLQPGTYSVKVEAPSFETQTRTGVLLQVQDRLNLDFKMVIGQVSQNVVVTDETPALQTQTSGLGQVVSSKTMTDLPLNGRDYLQLATLSTGVVETSTGTNGNTGGASSGDQDSFAANGARGTLNNFLLDGIDNNSNDTGGVLLRTSVDAIEEFKIQTNSFSAQFGRSGGAAINAVIKSGTNSYHGGVFEFFRNSALDARNYFESPNNPKASFKQNQFGGTVGGPIIRNKLFWFGDYQGTSIRNPTTFIATVPLPAEVAGDFSALCTAGFTGGVCNNPAQQIYDPSTNPKTPFPGNIIPTSRIDKVAQQYVDLYPAPNQPLAGLTNNYLNTPVDRDRIDQGNFRADYHYSDADQVFFRWSMSDRPYFNYAPLPGLANGGNSNTGNGTEEPRGAALGETHTFSPRAVNEFRTGFNYISIHRGVPPGGNVAPPANLLVPGVPENPNVSGLTLFEPSGYQRIGDPAFAPTILSSEERQITDVVNLIRGKQTIAIGAEARWSEYNVFQVPAPNGQFSFSGQFTGKSLADELLGLPLISTINTQAKVRNRQYVPSAFIQDDYKASSTLMLNLGLRYDYFSPIVSANNEQSNFDYQTQQFIVAGKNGASRGLVTPDHLNFAPRVGFAKTFFNQTVVSGAYGIFWSGQEIRTSAPLQLTYNLPFYYQPTFVSDGVTPILTVSGGFPALNPLNAPDPGVTSVDSRLKTPYYQEWNFSIQQGLPSSTTFELSYAASKGTHLQSLVDPNQVKTPGPGDVQSRRPYPNFGPFAAIEDRGNSSYNALQAKLEKHYTHGLYLLSSLTWSKVINDQPEICCNQPYAQNSWDIPADRGLADFNQGFRWITSYDYELPLGRGHRYLGNNRAFDLIAGGWHFGGIYSLATGFPFSPQMGYDPSNTGSQGLVRTNRIANGNLPRGQRNPNLWFDITAFPIVDPNTYAFGNAGRNILVGPGVNNLDGSLRKLFPISEAQNVEFRAEFFNLLNHPNFAQPDAFITDGPGQAGVITSTALANREVQFGLKYRF